MESITLTTSVTLNTIPAIAVKPGMQLNLNPYTIGFLGTVTEIQENPNDKTLEFEMQTQHGLETYIFQQEELVSLVDGLKINNGDVIFNGKGLTPDVVINAEQILLLALLESVNQAGGVIEDSSTGELFVPIGGIKSKALAISASNSFEHLFSSGIYMAALKKSIRDEK